MAVGDADDDVITGYITEIIKTNEGLSQSDREYVAQTLRTIATLDTRWTQDILIAADIIERRQ
jgi:hypothetical protein